MAGYDDYQDEEEYVAAAKETLKEMASSQKLNMLRALEIIILQKGRTELRRLAMQRYLEMTKKDNRNE